MGTNLREERFHRILTDVEPQLKARQDRMALMPEIWNLRRDIEYVKDQIEVAEARRAELAALAAAVKPEVAALTENVERLRAQKTTITGKAGLEELERSLAEKIRSFPRIKEEIRAIEKELPALAAQRAELEKNHEHLVARSRDILPEAAQVREAVKAGAKILTGGNRDIVGGLVPANIDPEVFDSIRDDLRERFQAYLGDVQENIEAIAKQTEDMKSALPEMRKEKVALAARRESLKLAAGDLGAWNLEADAIEALRADVAGLSEQTARLIARRDEALEALGEAQADSAALDEAIRRTRAERDQAAARLADLEALKEKIGEAGDIGEAIGALRDAAQKSLATARANQGIVNEGEIAAERLERVIEELAASDDRLRAVTEEFDRLLGSGLEK